MAISKDMLQAIEEYNENTRWARIYYNKDNGFTWFEDDMNCPKANHSSYERNENIAVLFEKGCKDCKQSEVTAITGADLEAKIAAL